ncbi:unnamed protein product [Cercopithifilaria johnstoni]|uniref:Uncharacterized protein n=1 Tax=Cercopithifilaria johnstoni TaxID=2874296 RepID=A0A8J2MUT7_9BILA|nr:unnamed protein product [Cercopithifilaria johnstoni]
MAFISSNAIIEKCCNLYSTENIQQNDGYLKNFIDNTNNSSGNDNDDNGNNNDNNGSNSNTNDYKLIKCKAQCDAQWKSDFHVHFQKNYDEEFYEFPLDKLITTSFDNFYTFCNITEQKLACWNMRCEMIDEEIPWSSDLHICAFKRLQFENSLRCLNLTSSGAHNECNKICRRVARRYPTNGIEKSYLHDVSANLAEIYQYWQLNKQCAFQICHLECRNELIKGMCEENETINGLDAIQSYYQYDLLDQLRSLIDSSTEHLYPLICRLYLPLQYHLELTNETSNEIKRSVLAIKSAVNGIVEMIIKS